MAKNVLVLGASYGSLLGIKLTAAGHHVKLVCLPDEAAAFNRDGAVVRLPVKGQSEPVTLRSQDLPGSLAAGAPGDFDPAQFDLVALAMQEPQYRSPSVRELLSAVAVSRVPCMSIMNMPPLAFLRRIQTIDTDLLTDCYTDSTVWADFDPATITLASPDPQAFRPPDEPINLLQVSLPTNFKVARFESDEATAMLRSLGQEIDALSAPTPSGPVGLPVKLKVHDSVFVPLAKWCMLVTGNYRCVHEGGIRPICDAVHSDLALSGEIYAWVAELCRKLGASTEDQVPFEKYAAAASGLTKPSSAARALDAGAQNIERLDRVVLTLAKNLDMAHPVVEQTVSLVDAFLEKNRRAAA